MIWDRDTQVLHADTSIRLSQEFDVPNTESRIVYHSVSGTRSKKSRQEIRDMFSWRYQLIDAAIVRIIKSHSHENANRGIELEDLISKVRTECSTKLIAQRTDIVARIKRLEQQEIITHIDFLDSSQEVSTIGEYYQIDLSDNVISDKEFPKHAFFDYIHYLILHEVPIHKDILSSVNGLNQRCLLSKSKSISIAEEYIDSISINVDQFRRAVFELIEMKRIRSNSFSDLEEMDPFILFALITKLLKYSEKCTMDVIEHIAKKFCRENPIAEIRQIDARQILESALKLILNESLATLFSQFMSYGEYSSEPKLGADNCLSLSNLASFIESKTKGNFPPMFDSFVESLLKRSKGSLLESKSDEPPEQSVQNIDEISFIDMVVCAFTDCLFGNQAFQEALTNDHEAEESKEMSNVVAPDRLDKQVVQLLINVRRSRATPIDGMRSQIIRRMERQISNDSDEDIHPLERLLSLMHGEEERPQYTDPEQKISDINKYIQLARNLGRPEVSIDELIQLEDPIASQLSEREIGEFNEFVTRIGHRNWCIDTEKLEKLKKQPIGPKKESTIVVTRVSELGLIWK